MEPSEKTELTTMSPGEIFDTAFKMIFRCFKYIFLMHLFFLLIEAVTGLVSVGFISIFSSESLQQILTRFILRSYIPTQGLLQVIYQLFSTVISMVISIIHGAMLNHLFINNYLGKGWTVRQSLDMLYNKFWALVGAWLVISLMITAGIIALCVGALVMFSFTLFVVPIIIHEDRPVSSAISRSFSLVSRNFWAITGIITIVFCIGLFFIMLQLYGFRIFKYFYGRMVMESTYDVTLVDFFLGDSIPGSAGMILLVAGVKNLGFAVYTLVVGSLFPLFPVLLYFNQVIRHENFGISSMIENYEKSVPKNDMIDNYQ
jgi:hypothetical protein